MGYKTYKQADSRWGKKNYNGSSNMATAGCGPTSVAMLAYAVDGKTDPWDVALFMKKNGYAIRNNGTAWNGIPAAMKAFGLKDVKAINVSSSMAEVWKYLEKGYCADFLFRAGSRGGITWTSSGHYVAVTDYKVKNGKHYLYTRDSGGRNHTGWYCYETQMRGLIPKVWVGLVKPKEVKPITKPTGKYSGNYPTTTIQKGSKGADVKLWQRFLNWYGGFKLKVDGDFGTKTDEATRAFQKTEALTEDGIVGTKTRTAAKKYKKEEPKPAPVPTKTNAQKICDQMTALSWPLGTDSKKWNYDTGAPTAACKKAMQKYGYDTKAEYSDCGDFTNTCVREAGIKPFTSLHGVKTAFPKTEERFDIVISGRVPKDEELKPGDIIRYKKTNDSQHAMMYFGNGIVCDAGHYHRFGHFYKNDHRYGKSNVKKSTIQVLRVKE